VIHEQLILEHPCVTTLYLIYSNFKCYSSHLLLFFIRLNTDRWSGGVEFNSLAGQILHNVENGSPPIQHLRK